MGRRHWIQTFIGDKRIQLGEWLQLQVYVVNSRSNDAINIDDCVDKVTNLNAESRGLTGSAVSHRFQPPEFKYQRGHV